MNTPDDVNELIDSLRTKDGVRREQARKKLVVIGKPAVAPLLALLSDPVHHVRWEACKALSSISDPATAPQLVNALRDENIEVQWLAAEGLIAIGRESIAPLLKALETNFDSVFLRQGAHHVLHAFERQKILNDKVLALLDTLRSVGPESLVAVAAHQALKTL